MSSLFSEELTTFFYFGNDGLLGEVEFAISDWLRSFAIHTIPLNKESVSMLQFHPGFLPQRKRSFVLFFVCNKPTLPLN